MESIEEDFVEDMLEVARGSEGKDDAKVVSGRMTRRSTK